MRVGKFEISIDLIEHDKAIVLAIMAGCIIIRAECLYYKNVYEYIAINDAFDELDNGAMLKEYHAIVSQNDDFTYSITWEYGPSMIAQRARKVG